MTTETEIRAGDVTEKKEIRKPDSCILLMTLGCNLKCKMCYLWSNKEEREGFPSVDEWKYFIDSIDRFSGKPFTIIFGGGEPLLYKEELLTLIDYARHKGFRTSLATSGYYMDRVMVERLCDAGLNYIAFTLYSLSSRTQDFLRGVKGSVRKVKAAAAHFAHYNPQVEIAIDTVLMEPSRTHLTQLTKWVQMQKHISRIFFQAVMQPFHTKPTEAWYREKKYSFLWPKHVAKMIKVIDELINLKRAEGNDGKITNTISQFEIFKQYFMAPDHFIKKGLCPTCNNGNFGMAPDGSVTLCPYMQPIGNIKDNSLEGIWYSETAQQRRAEIRACNRNCHHIVNCWYEEESCS